MRDKSHLLMAQQLNLSYSMFKFPVLEYRMKVCPNNSSLADE